MICKKCAIDLSLVDAEIELVGAKPRLYCPFCAEPLDLPQEPGLFFDEETQRYLAWTNQGQAPLSVYPLRAGSLMLRIPVQSVDIADCLFDRLVIFREGDGPTAPEAAHFTAVRPEWAHVIASCVSKTSLPSMIGYEVVTRDGWKSNLLTVPCLEITDPPGRYGTALYVWPDFEVPGWKKYYVSFQLPGVPKGLGTGRLHSAWESTESGRLRRTPLTDLDGELAFAPDRLVIQWTKDGLEHYGCYRTRVEEAPHFQTPRRIEASGLQLGLDFGTSNTAAAVRYLDRTRGVKSIPELCIRDHTLRLLNGLANSAGTWLPQPQSGSAPLSTIPSQLYFEAQDFAAKLKKSMTPISDYTIPYFQDGEGDQMSRLVGQFKWKYRLKRGLDAHAGILRYLYLRLALELYLAELVAEYGLNPQPLRLVTTYPLAFSEDDMHLHNQVFEELSGEITRTTGFKIGQAEPLDESHAGFACGEKVPDVTATLYMDVGGGTSDICISRLGDEGAEAYIVDSVEFAGEDVNSGLVAAKLTHWNEAQFRQQIVLNGSRTFTDPASFDNSEPRLRKAREVINRFRLGLVEIAARFAAAEALNKPDSTDLLGLMMFGSGWKTAFHGDSADEIAAAVQEAVEKRLAEYKANGVCPKPPRIRCHYPMRPKTVVARGAAASPVDNPFSGKMAERSTYLLQSVRVSLLNSPKDQTVPWSQRTPVTFDKKLRNITRIVPVDVAQFGFEDPARTGDAGEALLECTREGLAIVKSPFEYYVREIYKRTLKPTADAKV